MQELLDQIVPILLSLAAAAITAAAAYASAYLKARAGESQLASALKLDLLVQDVTDRHVALIETENGGDASGELKGAQKKDAAERGIKAELADIGKGIGKQAGKQLLGALAAGLSGRIEGSVFKLTKRF